MLSYFLNECKEHGEEIVKTMNGHKTARLYTRLIRGIIYLYLLNSGLGTLRYPSDQTSNLQEDHLVVRQAVKV